MAFRRTELGLLIQAQPEAGKAALLKLLKKYKGNITDMSAAEGYDKATIKRWISTLEIRAEVDKMREGVPVRTRGKAPKRKTKLRPVAITR